MRNAPDLSGFNKKVAEGLKPDGTPYRVLVTDDSKFVVKQLSQILVSEGFDVCGTAEDGEESIKLYKELTPDIVTLDITMPKKDGLTALKEILAYDSKAVILMISALGKEDIVKKALVLGAKNFIIKPLDRKKVLERLKGTLKH